jgi:hypothetical protein
MFTLDEVVPWGRSSDEYRRMFELADDELNLKIVDGGAGPASFSAEASRPGTVVVSCDPTYRWDANHIGQRITTTYEKILEQTRQNEHESVWDSIRSLEGLGTLRMKAMTEFLDDYARGKAEGRYVDAELPVLPFAESSFALALSSQLLFLYATQ